MCGTVAVMDVQEVPQDRVMFRLGMEKTVAGFWVQAFKKGNKKKNSKALRLIRNELIKRSLMN